MLSTSERMQTLVEDIANTWHRGRAQKPGSPATTQHWNAQGHQNNLPIHSTRICAACVKDALRAVSRSLQDVEVIEQDLDAMHSKLDKKSSLTIEQTSG